MTIPLLTSRHDYGAFLDEYRNADIEVQHDVQRQLMRGDLFYLLVYGLNRPDADADWLFERCREVQADPNGRLDLWAREHYKDLADDTPVLTANRGWTTHGELLVGDLVFAPNGAPVPVIALSDRYVDSECYRVTFNDGESIIAGAGHLWRLRRKSRHRIVGTDKRLVKHQDVTVSTAALTSIPGRHDVGQAEALYYPPIELPIHPYVLGAWLGDGYGSSSQFTCVDPEIIIQLRLSGVTVRHYGDIRYSIASGVTALLREHNLLGNKHIPEIYLTASIEQRLELLRGLMDTDGYCNVRGTATFAKVNERLAQDVYELVVSLGLKPRLRWYSNRHGGYYQVSFQAHKDRNPFHLPRKAARAIDSSYYDGSRYVKSVDRVATVPTRCIQVVGGMYCVGRSMVPTHNSTIITFALTIQDILRDPEVTIGIFSHTRPQAKSFLRQIKQELELNKDLAGLFPEILYANPRKESPKWSEDEGIVVKRATNPAAATVEAWGVVDGQPTGKHFSHLVYDDLVTRESVTTPEMMEKVVDALALSYNLGAHGGLRRFIGTRYHFSDAYRTVIDRGTAKARLHAATHDGSMTGEPVFLTQDQLDTKKRDMGVYIFSCQMLQNPIADDKQGFKRDWLRHYSGNLPRVINWYLLVDAANSKRKGSDYTAIWAVGLGSDKKRYCIPEVRDRLNLTERTNRLIDLHRKYKPVQVRYEQYGLQGDIAYILKYQEDIGYRFDIHEVAGPTSKIDRIKRLVPLFEYGEIYLPRVHNVTDYEGKTRDLIKDFIEEEYVPFPVPLHDDMLDALSRIEETEGRLGGQVSDKKIQLSLNWPKVEIYQPDEIYADNDADDWRLR